MTEAMYHGTQAALEPGDMLTPDDAADHGHRDHLSPGYVFATEHLTLAQQYAHGMPGGATVACYVYEVEPLGTVERDPADVAGSYRSRQPMRVVRLAAVARVVQHSTSSGWTTQMLGRWEMVA